MNDAIYVKNLSKEYDDFTLDKISFSLPKGTILGLVGENGAGKSTTINLIMNAIKRESGEVKVLGVDCQSKEFIKTKEDIGVVLDEAYFPELLNPKEVNSIMKYTYSNWDEKKFFALLKKFNLPEKKAFKDFSRGMKMKLAITVALSHHPKLLILDEATSGLDPMIRDEILNIFNDFTKDEDHSILLSSHIVSDLEKICDYIAFIHQGKLIFFEEKDAIFDKYAILKVSKEDAKAIPKSAILGKKSNDFEVELLVKKQEVNGNFTFEKNSLEEIIIFFAKEENK